MTERRPGERPAHVKPPTHLSPSPPVPEPGDAPTPPPPGTRDATRYGDWEHKGIAVDF